MNILITGANGYIGQRLIPVLLDKGHHLFCYVRNRQRLASIYSNENITILEVDLLKKDGDSFTTEIDVAYYLVHSMSTSGDFETVLCYQHFISISGEPGE